MRRFHFDFAKSLIKLNAITRYSLFQYRPSNGELISEKNHFCTIELNTNENKNSAEN